MDEESLVTLFDDEGPLFVEDVDQGARFVEQLSKHLTVNAACWIKKVDKTDWRLLVVSPGVDESRTFGFELIRRVLAELPEPRVEPNRVHFVSAEGTVGADLCQRQRAYPVRLRRGHTHRVGSGRDYVLAQELYLYPAPSAWPAHVARTRVVGIREDASTDPPRQIEEEIGFVEGLIGEDDFSRRFAEMVRSRFGSVEQFRARYPRVLLQGAA
jgi:hypothetical protein